MWSSLHCLKICVTATPGGGPDAIIVGMAGTSNVSCRITSHDYVLVVDLIAVHLRMSTK